MTWLMTIFSGVGEFFSGLPWLRITLLTAVLGSVVYGVHLIKINAQHELRIIELKQQAEETQKSFQQLHDQYQKDLSAVIQQKELAVKLSAEYQHQLEAIKNVKPQDDGPIRNVMRSTLDFLRKSRTGNVRDGAKNEPAH